MELPPVSARFSVAGALPVWVVTPSSPVFTCSVPEPSAGFSASSSAGLLGGGLLLLGRGGRGGGALAGGSGEGDGAVDLGDAELERVDGDLQLQRGGRRRRGGGVALGEVEGDLADAVHRDLGGAHAAVRVTRLPRTVTWPSTLASATGFFPASQRAVAVTFSTSSSGSRGRPGRCTLAWASVVLPSALWASAVAFAWATWALSTLKGLLVVDAGEFGGQRRLLGALRRVDLVERDLQRDVDGLAEQRDVEAGAQDDRVRPPVVAGGVGRGGRGEGERRRDEQPGRRGGHQTARGHAEVGAVQDGETPTETWSRRGRTWGQAAADDVVAGIFTHSG